MVIFQGQTFFERLRAPRSLIVYKNLYKPNKVRVLGGRNLSKKVLTSGTTLSAWNEPQPKRRYWDLKFKVCYLLINYLDFMHMVRFWPIYVVHPLGSFLKSEWKCAAYLLMGLYSSVQFCREEVAVLSLHGFLLNALMFRTKTNDSDPLFSATSLEGLFIQKGP